MHLTEIQRWQHLHNFNRIKKSAEKRTLFVVLITLTTMFIEIIAGWIFNSMALFADGWHMSTHAIALSISFIAYILARKHVNDKRYAFGTWKIEILGAYTNSIILGIVGLFVLGISLERIYKPTDISYDYALIVAVAGLLVNISCAIILQFDRDHKHHDHGYDLNLRSAYLHVVADALTSVLAILALLGVKYFQWNWLDPFVGIFGSLLIFRWVFMLVKDTSGILLDREMDSPIVKEISEIIESDGDSKICDLHFWRVAQNKYACILSIVAKNSCSVDEYKNKLKKIDELIHITVEINHCK